MGILGFSSEVESVGTLRVGDLGQPTKCNAQAARCTREVNRAARWVGNVANIQC